MTITADDNEGTKLSSHSQTWGSVGPWFAVSLSAGDTCWAGSSSYGVLICQMYRLKLHVPLAHISSCAMPSAIPIKPCQYYNWRKILIEMWAWVNSGEAPCWALLYKGAENAARLLFSVFCSAAQPWFEESVFNGHLLPNTLEAGIRL